MSEEKFIPISDPKEAVKALNQITEMYNERGLVIKSLQQRIKELEEKLKILLKGVPIDQAKDGEWYFVRTCSYRDPIRARWNADNELWEIGHEGGWAHEHTFKKLVLPAALLNEWDSEYGFPTPPTQTQEQINEQ